LPYIPIRYTIRVSGNEYDLAALFLCFLQQKIKDAAQKKDTKRCPFSVLVALLMVLFFDVTKAFSLAVGAFGKSFSV
jgi:hypothetical protein